MIAAAFEQAAGLIVKPAVVALSEADTGSREETRQDEKLTAAGAGDPRLSRRQLVEGRAPITDGLEIRARVRRVERLRRVMFNRARALDLAMRTSLPFGAAGAMPQSNMTRVRKRRCRPLRHGEMNLGRIPVPKILVRAQPGNDFATNESYQMVNLYWRIRT
jgi:hypothetical protein